MGTNTMWGQPPRLSTDARGNTVLVGADGEILLTAGTSGTPQLSGYGPLFLTQKPEVMIDFRNTASLSVAVWTGATGTLEVSRDYEYEGLPMLKVTMPAACTRVELGVASGLTLPSGWADAMGIPIVLPVLTDFSTIQLYLGDSTYTTYQLMTFDTTVSAVAGKNYIAWDNRAASINESGSTNPGSVNTSNVAQAKVRINKASGAAARVFYIPFLQSAPSHKAKICFTADDGYDEWYSWLKDQAILYGVPWSLGIDRGYVDTAGFMTSAQITAMAADASGLFEFYSHGKNNQSYTDVGAAAYAANVSECGEFLRGLGVSDPYAYHPYVKGQRGDDLDALLLAMGVRVARLAHGVSGETYKPLIMAHRYGANPEIKMRMGLSLESTVSLATAKTAVDNACSAGGVLMIMAHEFVTSGASGLQWTYADAIALMAYVNEKEAKGLCDKIKGSELADFVAI